MKCQIEGVYSLVNSSKQGAEGGEGSCDICVRAQYLFLASFLLL
jgi:hypothetical protein